MKNGETADYYESAFSVQMADFIRYKRSQGLKYTAVPLGLRSFSRFLAAKRADGTNISKEWIEEWCSPRPNEKNQTRHRRIIETTQFLKYLLEKGFAVHLPRSSRKSRESNSFVPYIFSGDELCRFFGECDRIRARKPSVMPRMLPVLFRLLLGSGLRISEALELRVADADLDNGILTIRKAKFDKDRLIPLSDSVLATLRLYSAERHKIPKSKDAYFFTHQDGRGISQDNIYRWFRRLIWAAGISHGGRGSGPRVHDFRHTFSVYSLKSMTDKGKDIYCALPLLSTYLGHASISATGQYVRLTQDMFPEIVNKASAIAAFVIPRGGRS
jgi:site-specific recombinase XerD